MSSSPLQSAGLAENADDYAKLSHYLHMAVTSCGVDVLDPTAFAYDAAATTDNAQKVNILMLALGKQFGLESLSYKTVFLDDYNILGDAPNNQQHAQHIRMADAVERYQLQVDPILLGGMIPVQPTHVLVCSLEWVRTYYAEPAKRIKQEQQSSSTAAGGGSGHRLGSASEGNEDDDNNNRNAQSPAQYAVTDDEVRALFVRNSTAAAMEEDARDMASKLQDLIAAKRQAKSTASSPSFESFSGQGQSLGSAATDSKQTAAAASTNGIVWDAQTLGDTTTTTPVDEKAPTTSIAVRLLNGQRKVIKINQNQTVHDLAKQCAQEARVSGGFSLVVAGFPPQPLANAQATLVQAGLTGRAQVTMKKAE